MTEPFKEGNRITWNHRYTFKGKPYGILKHGEYQRLRKHKSSYRGPQMAVVILDDKFCETYAPISELTKERV